MWFIFLTLAAPVMSVDRHKFKRCEDANFCYRNRYLAQHHVLTQESGLRYDMDFQIDPGSVSLSGHEIAFEAKSVFEGENPFAGVLSVYEGGVLHFLLKEKQSIFTRYRVPYGEVINPEQLRPVKDLQQASKSEDKLEYVSGTTRVLLSFVPFKLQTYYRDQLVITVNDRSLFNFERYRLQEDHLPSASSEDETPNVVPILDGSQVRDDVGSTKYQEGQWRESFGGQVDAKKKGPSSVAVDVTFAAATQVYGIPEHADSLALRDTVGNEPYRLFNGDIFEYELNERMALYGAIPFMVSRAKGVSGGFFWVNPSETFIDIESASSGKRTHWMSETGVLEFMTITRADPMAVIQAYTLLTGPATLPPLFSLGFHQCRWNYNDQGDVLAVNAGFDRHDIPVDVIWLDIEHTDDKKYFTWDSNKFPDPSAMLSTLGVSKRKLVTIVDPHLKKTDSYPLYQEMSRRNYLVQRDNGEQYDGHCWPGTSVWPDFTREEVRLFWAQQFAHTAYPHSAPNLFTWNDMNEPAVFNSAELTMPRSNLHGDYEHRDIHNIYGYYMHKATFQGHSLRGQERPFVLTRSFFAGSQKWGAVWTGDNQAKWEYLDYSVPMMLGMATAGFSFIGSDVGGFFGDPSKELLVRWHQVGAYSPFFRAHAHIETKRREPWLFGEPATTRIRNAIRERYQLLPYWYTLFYQYHSEGSPVVRPLFVQFPNDDLAASIDRSYMVGSGLLVAPPLRSDQREVDVYLPPGRWFDYHTWTEVPSGRFNAPVSEDSIPVYLHGGAIVPRQDRARRSSGLMASDPYTLIVALDSSFEAFGHVYSDDWSTNAYQSGTYMYSLLTFKDSTLKYQMLQKWQKPNTVERIVILGLPSVPKRIVVNGAEGYEVGFYDYTNGAVVIKLPSVYLSVDWSLTLKY